MIVTRQRRKPFPWKRLILPVIAIVLAIVAFVWAPSRNVIANGPLAPAWKSGSSAFDTIAAPFHFAAQNQLLTQRNQQIVALQKQVADLKSQDDAKDKKISALGAQLGTLQAQAAAARNAQPNASASPGAAGAASASRASGGFGNAAGASSANDLASGATANMRRTASYWANMEPENAAKLVQKLPVPYVAQVMALMSPDAVGAILDALPASYAAQLTQEHPELKR
ncbi:MAG: hypothetical protein KGN02_07965 [bacterium]|nr:hypothetical protein [bacterium]